ncbi:M1 family metallopeptidase [Kutzneria viridogrisea]|uniref:Aminopeptidase N n=2 Tax=Kutzneria viridogrisea TaxID=47990 RepID=A0ABR6BXJ4_9PSEU|nr:aminopeptidase N [Kutzneria viridogrisea]
MALRSKMLVAVATMAAGVLLAAPAGAGTGSAGGQSLGDPYYPADGNTGYDVKHYDLRLKYQPGADQLSGTATILATTTQDLSSFSFDFGLTAKSVLVNNRPAQFTSKDAKLLITPAATLAKSTPITVVVEYSGVPSEVTIQGEKDWVKTPDGALAVQEPHIAAFWYPANDHPLDKATYDVSIAVPDGTEAISNGVLASKSSKAGWTRWNWRSTKPQATYLTFLTIGHYDIRSSTAPNGQPVITAYHKDLGASTDAAAASLERTPEILDWESKLFGPYPFEAQGGVVPATGIGFALEDQTRPVYSPKFFAGGSNTSVVVHENAHQWFGDSVSVANWRNIWLNEGFASYAEWLWSEAKGEGTAQELFDYYYNSKPASDPSWQIPTGDPGPDGQFNSFAVYNRGAMALHQLRLAVGDDKFFEIIRTWTAQQRYGNATNEQFIALAEKVSGKPVYGLLSEWLFTKGRPVVAAKSAARSFAAHTVTVPKSVAVLDRTHEILASQH